MRWPIKIICKTCTVVSNIPIVLYTKDSICSVKSGIFFRMISSENSFTYVRPRFLAWRSVRPCSPVPERHRSRMGTEAAPDMCELALLWTRHTCMSCELDAEKPESNFHLYEPGLIHQDTFMHALFLKIVTLVDCRALQ